jgi:DNA-directed RNA polymerase subunit omega
MGHGETHILMRDDYLQSALKVISDQNILINVVSRRVKQLRRGARPLVESLEKLLAEDIALREIAEGKISYELARIPEEPPASRLDRHHAINVELPRSSQQPTRALP